MVHGVGGHDHLSNLLRTYQSFRSNLTSTEPPVMGEDQMPGWRLTRFEEGATPPFLVVQPRVVPPVGSVGAVRIYEVNYSSLAGVVRRNHRIDLSKLFLGLDLAACAARQRQRQDAEAPFGRDTARLGRCLQRFSGVLTAGTDPIIGLPSLVFRNYLGTFIATFTRFFEDVATFALDKNGEQLIAAHLDRTLGAIYDQMQNGDRLVVAAHSLGSVVVHNFVVRHWPTNPPRFPNTVVTFGSPIGLLMWGWLYLDFRDMNFRQKIMDDTYFGWNPIGNIPGPRPQLRWINVVNCGDPIATAFPAAAVDLSVDEADVRASLTGEDVLHRFFGPAKVTRVGAAHSQYLNDKRGFVMILLRAAGLSPGAPEQVEGTRTAEEHWHATTRVLGRLQWIVLAFAWLFAGLYCFVIARALHTPAAFWFLPLFLWPGLTVGYLAFFQRLILGGPTKRITPALIRELKWADIASLPYRLRATLLARTDKAAEVNPMAPSPAYGLRLLYKAIAFVPTVVMMAVPVAGTLWWAGRYPSPAEIWARLWSLESSLALIAFMAYVMSCAGFELVRTWREAVNAA